MTTIHPAAIVHPKAELDEGVEIGPYSIISEKVKLGSGTWVGPHVVIKGRTEIGTGNKIYQFSSIGEVNQDIKYRGEDTCLKIGDKNTIREYVTMQIGTEGGGGITQVGNGNLIMVYAHIAHDCIIGSNCILANNTTLAGHITIDDGSIIGGLVGIHQFCNVGTMAIIGGCSKVVQDVPPYMMADGHPAEVHGLNLIGLKRRGFTSQAVRELKKFYKIVFRSGLNITQAVQKVKQELTITPEIQNLLDFMSKSKRGICK